MLRNVYLPEVVNGSLRTNGNWELTMMDAAIGIAVFLEDRAAFDKAVSTFRARVPAYIYLTGDGAFPKGPAGSGIDTRAEVVDYWQGQDTFVDGLSQETCRDFTHTGYGRVRPGGDRAHRRDRQDPGAGPLPGDRRPPVARARPARQVPARGGRSGVAVRREPHPGAGAGHRGRLQRAAQPDGHRDEQHAGPHRAAAPGGHQQPLRRLGDPHPRRQPELGEPPDVPAR
ncbi:hypothetical protein GCM10020216_015780 [Nonomuraea helvata]